MGRGRAAEGHGLQLSDPAMAQGGAKPDCRRSFTGCRSSDIQPSRAQPDDGAAEAGPEDFRSAGLGAGRVGRLRSLTPERASAADPLGGIVAVKLRSRPTGIADQSGISGLDLSSAKAAGRTCPMGEMNMNAG